MPDIESRLETKCPKCLSEITCEYLGDLGALDFYYTWKHKCTNSNCDYNREFSTYESSGYTGPSQGAGKCPGCNDTLRKPENKNKQE